MYCYQIYGLKVCSEMRLSDIAAADGEGAVDISICCSRMPEAYLDMDQNVYGGSVIENVDGSIIIFYVDQGVFKIEHGTTIEYQLFPGYSQVVIEQILLDLCMNCILTQRNATVLHGSSVWKNGICFIISGASGVGKSTLVSKMIEEGYYYLSDDQVLITKNMSSLEAVPSFPYRKLKTDVYSNSCDDEGVLIPYFEPQKYRIISSDRYLEESMKVNGIVIIRECDTNDVGLEEVKGTGKIALIRESLYEGRVCSVSKDNKNIMSDLLEIASAFRVFLLYRPKGRMTVNEQFEYLEGIDWS